MIEDSPQEHLDKEAREVARTLRSFANTVGKLRKTVEAQEHELNKIKLLVGLLDYWALPPHKRYKLRHNLSPLMEKLTNIVEEHTVLKKEVWEERLERILLIKKYDPERFAKHGLFAEILEEAETQLGIKKKQKGGTS